MTKIKKNAENDEPTAELIQENEITENDEPTAELIQENEITENDEIKVIATELEIISEPIEDEKIELKEEKPKISFEEDTVLNKNYEKLSEIEIVSEEIIEKSITEEKQISVAKSRWIRRTGNWH